MTAAAVHSGAGWRRACSGIGAKRANLKRDQMRREGPAAHTSAVSLPWNIGRANAAAAASLADGR